MKKIDLKILTTRIQCLKWSFRPTFNREKKFRNGAVAIEKETCTINLDKPIYIERSILDLNKVLMQDFHYNYIKNKNDNKTEMR